MPLRHPQSALFPFFFNCSSVEDSANRIEQEGPISPKNLTNFRQMLYVPLTETAMGEPAFARTVAKLVLQAYFDPTLLLVLRLPSTRDGKNDLTRGIAAILPALGASGVVIPRTRSSSIMFATQDVEEDHQLIGQFPLYILVHESFDFWRHTFDFYARSARVTVLAGSASTSMSEFLPDDISMIYGPNAVRRAVDTAACA
jgi:hypothetical protein